MVAQASEYPKCIVFTKVCRQDPRAGDLRRQRGPDEALPPPESVCFGFGLEVFGGDSPVVALGGPKAGFTVKDRA